MSRYDPDSLVLGVFARCMGWSEPFQICVCKSSGDLRTAQGERGCPFAGKAVPVWDTVSRSIPSNPRKDDGKYWHFPSVKMMAFAQVIKAPTLIASLHCSFQRFSSLKNKNLSE